MKAKIKNYINSSIDNLKDKIVVVTGANSGLGFAMCRVLLIKEAKVVMACRSLERANNAKNELLKEFPNGDIDIILYDQSNLEFIDNFTKELIVKYPEFYGLILNAGILESNKKKVNNDEVDNVIKVNSFGTIKIIENLQEFLNNSPLKRRIILQSSITGRLNNNKELNELKKHKYSKYKGYSISKNIIHSAYSFYKENNTNENVVYGLAEPGVSGTNIIRNYPKWFANIAKAFLNIFCNDNVTGCLPAITLLNEENDSTYYVPKYSSIKGLPKIGKYKEKYKNDKLIIQIIDEIKNK